MVEQKRALLKSKGASLFAVLIVLLGPVFIPTAASALTGNGEEKVSPSVLQSLGAGRTQDVIVLFDDSSIQNEAETMRENLGVNHDTPGILEMKKAEYSALKRRVLGFLPAGGQEILQDYSHLPMMFMRIDSMSGMEQLLGRPEVVRVYENGVKFPIAVPSNLALINQPQVASLGMTGGGTAVAVLDTGVNYTLSTFGTCSGSSVPHDCCPSGNCSATPPLAPASCKVACVHDFAPSDGQLDVWPYHGTNVSGIVIGVAPATKVIGLDVFSTGGIAYDSNIIAAINWCIAKKAAYNIVALNLSFGDNSDNPAPCSSDPLASPISNAKAAGILAAAASGNNGVDDSISSPACVPAAVSVGAVYDANYGWEVWTLCADSTTAADEVACFSNSADYLTLLAPGTFVTAAGITMSGTSQAAAHISGSIAVLRGQNAFPAETVDQTVLRMTSTGRPDLDTRNGLVKPRIDLLAAVNYSGISTYSIVGTVTIAGTTTPISGVTINLSGAASASTTTDSNGNYTLSGLPNGGYTVTPVSTAYTFSPVSTSVTVNGRDVVGQGFAGTPVGVTFSVSGTVTQSVNGEISPLAGVTITLSGAGTGQATTDSNGNYTLSGLAGGNYTITPGMTNYSFTPANRSVTLAAGDVSGMNFTGTYTGGGATTYSISGTITTSSGGIVPGVTVNISGAASGSASSNGAGTYAFTGLSNGSYTVTPVSTAYTFTPVNRSVTVNGSNVVRQDFVATAVGGGGGGSGTFSISGRVVKSFNGLVSPLPGVTMTLSGAAIGTTTTNTTGNYTFTGLPKGSYTVKPTFTGYAFTPSSKAVTIGTSNVFNVNFTGTKSLIP